MRRIFSITLFSILSIYIAPLVIAESTIKNHNQHNAKKKSHSHKPTLAIGVAYDQNGTLWLAEVKNKKLLVSYSRNKGESFSTPKAVTTGKNTGVNKTN